MTFCLLQAFLGLFFRVHALALLEDLPINQVEWEKDEYRYDYIDKLYNQASTNCFIAAALYVGVFAFSFIMWRVNKRADYTMS